MKTKEVQEKLLSNMKRWQKIEDAAVSTTGQIIAKTENPVLRLVMEIIQHDSQMHYRVQQLIADSLERTAVSLTPEEMGVVWEMVEQHLAIEKKMVSLVEESLDNLKGKKMVVQEYLLNYLLEDEKKHDNLLANFENIKKGMYPYG